MNPVLSTQHPFFSLGPVGPVTQPQNIRLPHPTPARLGMFCAKGYFSGIDFLMFLHTCIDGDCILSNTLKASFAAWLSSTANNLWPPNLRSPSTLNHPLSGFPKSSLPTTPELDTRKAHTALLPTHASLSSAQDWLFSLQLTTHVKILHGLFSPADTNPCLYLLRPGSASDSPLGKRSLP